MDILPIALVGGLVYLFTGKKDGGDAKIAAQLAKSADFIPPTTRVSTDTSVKVAPRPLPAQRVNMGPTNMPGRCPYGDSEIPNESDKAAYIKFLTTPGCIVSAGPQAYK
jgi:hypothetical protein